MNSDVYSTYKESGVEWLGEVPDHWPVLPTKRFFKLVAEPAPDDNAHELLSIYTDIGVRPRKDLEARGNRASTTDGYWVVKKGDLIVNKLLAWMGAIGMSEYDGVTSPAYDILRQTKPLDPKFYHYLFRCGICFTEFRKYSRGIMDMRLRLYFDQLGQLPMPFPPLDEQTAIASFLDTETSKIDALVAEQRRLITLLKEKRQAVISHAVTKGLNPDVRMKPSGIEWLGDVPEHWAVMKLGRVTLDRCDGPFGSGLKSQHYTEEGIRVVRLNNIRHDFFDAKDAAFIDPHHYNGELGSGHDVIAGDLLIAGLGDANNAVGRACVAPDGIEPAMVKADCFRFRLDDQRVISPFISAQLTIGAPADAGLMSTGTTRSRMPLSVTTSRMIAIPAIDEQQTIVKFISDKTALFDRLSVVAERAIELLQERRTALISAAVTGKIDVREFACQETA